jgi:hypothetical protein
MAMIATAVSGGEFRPGLPITTSQHLPVLRETTFVLRFSVDAKPDFFVGSSRIRD